MITLLELIIFFFVNFVYFLILEDRGISQRIILEES